MPMIREAIELRDDLALGYRSPGDYIRDRFGSALSKLGLDLRREVVRELTDAGLSTRAIAPVVGVSHMTVSRDRERVTPVTREPAPERRPVVGVDGKTYPRPEPSPRAPQRRALTDVARDLGIDLRGVVDRIERLHGDNRFAQSAENIAARERSDIIRAVELLSEAGDASACDPPLERTGDRGRPRGLAEHPASVALAQWLLTLPAYTSVDDEDDDDE
jgi:hypothetical protein